MSEEGRDHFEIPKEMRSMAEASFDQARQAFEKFLATAQQAAGSFEERGATVRAGAKDISTRGDHLCRKERPGLARLCAVVVEGQGCLGSDEAAQRICAGANARPGGAGQRNGPDRQPRRHGGGQAQELTRADENRCR